MKLLLRWAVSGLAIFVAVMIVPGIHLDAASTQAVLYYALIAIVLGFVNALIRPLLLILTCPLQVITLGLFAIAVNAFCFWIVGWFAESVLGVPFYVDGFLAALAGSIVVSVVSTLLNIFIPD